MDYNREKIFELGKSFDAGLIGYESLSASDKYALNKYYALKNEQLDGQIQDVTANLSYLNNHLDNVYKTLKEIK